MTWLYLLRASEDDLLRIGDSIYHVSYDCTGPVFRYVVGPVLSAEMLDDIADDMQREAGGIKTRWMGAA